METRTQQYYITTDTPLAAWLRTEGFDIPRINKDTFPYQYLFEDSPALHKSIKRWELMEGEADFVQRFYFNYRELLHKINPKVGRL